MNNINCLVIEGKIYDITSRISSNGTSQACMKVGINHTYKVAGKNEYKDEISYFKVEAYGNLAEYCKTNGKKGNDIQVVGRLKENRMKDETGKLISELIVIAEQIEIKMLQKQQKPQIKKNKEPEYSR